MTLAATKKQYQEAILDGMARSLWVMAYADWAHGAAICENCDQPISREDDGQTWVDETEGDTCPETNGPHVPSDTQGPNVASAGEDWDDAAPETPDAAYLAANALTKLLVAGEGMKAEKSPLADIFELAMTIDEGGFDFAETEGPSEDQRKERERKFELADDFGSSIAMMALGTGVSWFDDHKEKSGTGELRLTVPDFSVNYDGEELQWEGKEGTAVVPGLAGGRPITVTKVGKQQATYVEGGPTTQTRLGRITIVNADDESWTKHRYVIALGHYGHVFLVYANGLDSAMDEVIDWCVENAPGLLSDESVERDYQEAIARGESEDQAHDIAEQGRVSGGNAGNFIEASEVAVLATDPSRTELIDLAGLTENPAGLTAKGERMYEEIRRGYQQVGNQRAKEVAARTVLSRAKSGTRGLLGDKGKAPRRARKQKRKAS